ncbi:Colon cancer-associated Mic1-like [Phytophthora cinnamomi]|nr:Colon cancer-associated Mic1-like [Phytophthora cinnamomi]
MSDGHLYLSARGGADYAEAGDGRHAWFDATHQSVLLLDAQSLALRQLPLDASLDPVQAATAGPTPAHNVATLYDFSEPDAARNPAPIVLMQLSVDGQFLAMQHSDIEVQVLHRASRASYWVLCKSKAGNRILHGGVVWNTHSVKPTSSQDLFLVTKMGLEHHRVSSKRRKCALHRTVGLYVHEFWYAASHGVLLLSSGSRANEIVPFLLHGAYVEKLPKLVFSTAVSKQDLHLVSLSRALDFNVSLFFDIKCDGNISDPFSAPLPISARPPGHPPPKAKQVPEAITAPLKTADAMLNEFDSELLETVYGSERRNQNVVDSEDESRGASSGDPTKPGQNPAEQALGRIKASPPARNARGFLLIRQAEFYRDVWSVILQDPNTAKSCNLSAYIIEYIKNLRDNKVPVENITYVAVAECFVATGDPGKLYQFLHYHVLTDSVKLAELMVRHGCAYPALMQVGLDMYFRLREICPLVRTLLDLGQAGRAIEIAWRNMGLTSCDAAVLPGVVFFDSLVKSVTSSKQRSSLQVAQMMGNLLLFLKMIGFL